MRKWFTSLLGRIVRGIRKMDIIKQLILVLFVFLFNLLFPILSQMLDPQKRVEAISIYPNIWWIIAFQIIFALALLFFIRLINKMEKKRDDDRLKEIIKEVLESQHPLISFKDKGSKRKHGK
jgi:hypothetical protein